MPDPLISVRNLHLSLPDMASKRLFSPAKKIDILKDLSFDLPRGTVTGIVGESGSGKSSLGRCLVRLHRPSSGQIRFEGHDIASLDEPALKPFRRDLQMAFQDPLSSLNPRHRISRIVGDPLKVHGFDNVASRVDEALDRVHLGRLYRDRYPHQLSGGQRQRVGIARAIALGPRFLLADEIVSGLDVSTQAQILALLEELVSDHTLTLAFISHDLSVIRRLCSHVIVLRAGEIVEQGPVEPIFTQPNHAYTRALRDAIPLPEPDPNWLAATPLEEAGRTT